MHYTVGCLLAFAAVPWCKDRRGHDSNLPHKDQWLFETTADLMRCERSTEHKFSRCSERNWGSVFFPWPLLTRERQFRGNGGSQGIATRNKRDLPPFARLRCPAGFAIVTSDAIAPGDLPFRQGHSWLKSRRVRRSVSGRAFVAITIKAADRYQIAPDICS